MTPKESDNTKIAVISNNISYIQKDIAEIKSSLKDTYASKEQLADVAVKTEERLVRLESASLLWKWLSPTLAATTGAILTVLIISFLGMLKHG